MQLNGSEVRIIDMKMEEKYKKLLGSINFIEPPKGLGTRILERVNAEKERLMRIRTWVFGSGTVASFGLSLWAVIYLIKSAQESGFVQYLSLIFSENGVMLTYWRELSLSLVESLPIVSLIIFLSAIGFFIWSFTKMISNVHDRNVVLFSFN